MSTHFFQQSLELRRRPDPPGVTSPFVDVAPCASRGCGEVSLGVRRRRLWVRPDRDGGIEIAVLLSQLRQRLSQALIAVLTHH